MQFPLRCRGGQATTVQRALRHRRAALREHPGQQFAPADTLEDHDAPARDRTEPGVREQFLAVHRRGRARASDSGLAQALRRGAADREALQLRRPCARTVGQARQQHAHGIGADEDRRIESPESIQDVVDRRAGLRIPLLQRHDLEQREFVRFAAGRADGRDQRTGLPRGARHQRADALQGAAHVISPRPRARAGSPRRPARAAWPRAAHRCVRPRCAHRAPRRARCARRRCYRPARAAKAGSRPR